MPYHRVSFLAAGLLVKRKVNTVKGTNNPNPSSPTQYKKIKQMDETPHGETREFPERKRRGLAYTVRAFSGNLF